MDEALEAKIVEIDARAKSNTYRLNELAPVVKEIKTMSEAIVEMTVEMKHVNQSVGELKNKVDAIEQEPAKKWKDSTKALFNAILGALGAAIAGGAIYVIQIAIR